MELGAWDLLFNSLVNHDYQITITVLDRDYLSRWIERYPGASIVAPTFFGVAQFHRYCLPSICGF